MPSSYSASLRLELQFDGENVNTWGDKLNAALQRLDESVAGWATIALSGSISLTTANGTADQARLAMFKFTGAGPYTVTVPAVSKRYDVWNATASVLTLTNGSTSVTLQPSEVVAVINDGGANFARVQPTDFGAQRITSVADPLNPQDVATKNYADNLAFTANAGILPGQVGNAGKFLTTNGAVASWSFVTAAADYIADQAAKVLAAKAQAIAFAVAL